MGCISLKLGLPNNGIVSVGCPSTGNVSTDPMDTGWFGTTTLNKNPNVKASKVGNVKLNLLLICRVGKGNYLRVTPSEVQYIWVDNTIDYNVWSNTDWILN